MVSDREWKWEGLKCDTCDVFVLKAFGRNSESVVL